MFEVVVVQRGKQHGQEVETRHKFAALSDAKACMDIAMLHSASFDVSIYGLDGSVVIHMVNVFEQWEHKA